MLEQMRKNLSDPGVAEAAKLVADTVRNGRFVYLVSGDAWSNAVYEPFLKPGMLCALSPMTEPTLSTVACGSRAYYLRNAPHVGEFLCGYYRSLTEGDCILVADQGGAAASEEIVAFAKANGMRSIRISLTPDGADVGIPLQAEGTPAQTSAALSLSIAYLAYAIVAAAREQLENADAWLPFTEENAAHNERLLEKYRFLIKKL